MTKRVYSPEGEPFDVSDARATDLVLQHGWSQTPHDAEAVPLVQPAPAAEPAQEERGPAAPSKRWRSKTAERDAGGEVDLTDAS